MTRNKRDEELIRTLRCMRDANTYTDRYTLWTRAESLVTEWKEMTYEARVPD